MRLSLVKIAGFFLVISILSVSIKASELVTYEGTLEGFGEKEAELTIIIKNDTNEYKTAVNEDGTFKFENIQPGEYQQYIMNGAVEISTSPIELTKSNNLTITRTDCGIEIQESFIDGRVVLRSYQMRQMGQGDPSQYMYLHPGISVIYNDFKYSRYSSNPVYPPYIHVRGGRHYYTDYFFNGVSFRDPFSGILNATFIPEVQNFTFLPGNQATAIGNDLTGYYSFETEEGREKFSGMIELKTDNLYSGSFDHNYYTMAFSGPLIDPDIATFSFAAKRTYLGDKNPTPKTDELYGVDQLPNNSFSNYAISGRVDLTLGAGIYGDIIYDGSFSYYQDYIHYFNNPDYPVQIEHTPRLEDKNYAISSNWLYEFNQDNSIKISGAYFKAEHKKGDGILFDNLEAYYDYLYYPLFDNYSLFREGIFDESEYEPSVYTSYTHKISSYNQVQAEYIRHLTKSISLTAGWAYRKYTVRCYDNEQVASGSDFRVFNYGFDSYDNISDEESYFSTAKNPSLFSLYVESKMIFNQIMLFPGLRVDRFDYDALVMRNPARPFDPDGLEGYSATSFEEADLVEAPTHTKLSPRLRLLIPLHDKVDLRFAFRHNYQFLPFDYIYNDWQYVEDRISSGSYFPVRNARMEPVKSQQVELGLDISFGEASSIGATVYQYDFKNELSQNRTLSFPTSYEMYESDGESRGKGVEAYFIYNEQAHFDFMIRGDYNSVKGPYDGTDPSYNIIWKNDYNPDRSYYNLTYQRSLNAYCQLNVYPDYLFHLSLLASYIDGTKHTPGMNYNLLIPTAEYNSGSFDGSFRIDLHLEKDIRLGEFEFIPYLTINNLLDEKIINFVYHTSGLPDETGFLDTESGQQMAQDPVYLERYQIWQANPRHYNSPRQIFTGIRISF